MTGLSDTDFDDLTADLFGEPAAEPSPAEPESPAAISQTEPEVTASDIQEPEPDPVVAEAEAEPDPRLAEIERREAELLQREVALTEQRNRAFAQLEAMRERQIEQAASAYYQQLTDEHGPEVAEQYKALRTTDLQRRQQAEQRANGAEHGLTAAMIAVESLMSPEQFQQVLALTSNLVGYQDANQMQQALQQERDRQVSSNAEIQALQDEMRTLRMRLEAKDRDELADAVDRGTAAPAIGLRAEDATDMETFYERLGI